jgi:hypothetical protein
VYLLDILLIPFCDNLAIFVRLVSQTNWDIANADKNYTAIEDKSLCPIFKNDVRENELIAVIQKQVF